MNRDITVIPLKRHIQPRPRWVAGIFLICIALGNILFWSCAFMPFCADGRLFDKEQIPQIVEHETTRQQVLELFGEPLETNSYDMSRASFWRYRYVYLGAVTVQRAELEINFDGDIVSGYQFDEKESRY
jgi:outer membrane protein assembly factor BamE (lipoprotein component of BamABCDE complex)